MMEQSTQVGQREKLPLEAEQLAGKYQLGEPQAQYRVGFNTQGVINWGVIGTVLAGICLFGALGASNLPAMIFLLLLAVIFVNIMLYKIFQPLIYRSWRVYVCAEGFLFKRGDKNVAFYWKEIEAVWSAVTRHYQSNSYIGGISGSSRAYVGSSHKYTVRRKDGVQVILDDRFDNVEEFGDRLNREVSKRLWPQVMSAYSAGHTITFGPLAISKQGVNNGNKLVAWDQINEIDVKQGMVTVRQGGKWLNWSSIRARDVPNLFVFLRLANTVLKDQK